jgi:hypothetical protein
MVFKFYDILLVLIGASSGTASIALGVQIRPIVPFFPFDWKVDAFTF